MLLQALRDHGFEEVQTGGNCRAMVRRRDGLMDVVTSTEGDLPEDGDWLFVTYAGDWLADPDVLPLDTIDSGSTSIPLVEWIDL